MFDNSQVSDKQVIPVGLRQEGCELKTIKLIKETGDWVFSFERNGAVLDHREFAPKKGANVSDETFKRGISMQVSRIAHISRAFLDEATHKAIKVEGTEEQLLANIADTFRQYMVATVKALQVDQSTGTVGKAKGVKCALKVVYRETKGKHYASLPSVPVFISTENHPKQFEINPQYDKFEIPEIKPDAPKAEFSITAPPAGGTPPAV